MTDAGKMLGVLVGGLGMGPPQEEPDTLRAAVIDAAVAWHVLRTNDEQDERFQEACMALAHAVDAWLAEGE